MTIFDARGSLVSNTKRKCSGQLSNLKRASLIAVDETQFLINLESEGRSSLLIMMVRSLYMSKILVTHWLKTPLIEDSAVRRDDYCGAVTITVVTIEGVEGKEQ